jgi:hypothetical protein
VSSKQREIMLEFMEENQELAYNKWVGPLGAQKKERLWLQLSQILNSCPSGATKDAGKWAKVIKYIFTIFLSSLSHTCTLILL